MAEEFRADFGRTTADYSRHRAGFPDAFFDRIAAYGVGGAGQCLLDLGTGTGTLARGFARRGVHVTALDPSPEMLSTARRLAAEEGVDAAFVAGRAEETGLPDAAFDAVTAGQCWHWFDSMRALAEVRRLLVPAGTLVICHYDWLPLAGNVVAATERLIQAHNPDWPLGGGTGFYPQWATDAALAGFVGLETFSFDRAESYSHEAWRGRIRASAGVGGSLAAPRIAEFDAALAALLASEFPDDPLQVPHRCWALVCRR